MIRKHILLLSLLVILTACRPRSISDKTGTCPVTTPSQQTSTLPTNVVYEGRFWYGVPALWTNLPNDGTWQDLLRDNGYTQKTAFWREGFIARDEPNPALTVSGRRLDASGQTFSFSNATHGWDETGDFMLMGINIPTEGCWEITAEYREAKLTFVVQVKP